jgi:hypothetical protein
METEIQEHLRKFLPREVVQNVDTFLIIPPHILELDLLVHRKKINRVVNIMKFIGYSKPSAVKEFTRSIMCPACLPQHPSSRRRWRCFVGSGFASGLERGSAQKN